MVKSFQLQRAQSTQKINLLPFPPYSTGVRQLIGIALLLCAHAAAADSLRDEIVAADKALFDAFNSQNAAAMVPFFSEDLEFYHDKGGLTGYADTVKQFKENFARGMKLRRDLVDGSLEVYPIPKYGAMQIGAHRFCHMENGKEDCGTFRFVHVWQKNDARWQITRVVSYGH